MLLAITLSLLLPALSAAIHYEALSWLNDVLVRTTIVPRRAKVLVAILGSIGSHICQIALFGGAYLLLRDELGLGNLSGEFRDSLMNYFYFSSETYTSLGFGDIYPAGGTLRLLVGIEALTGLVMIGWTASFTYLEMARYWGEPGPRP